MNRKRKTKLHFNRINMQRGDARVWSAHNSQGCHMATKIQVVHDGQVVMETVYKPTARQPRAYFVATARVRMDGDTAVVEV
jgi:hypothetical protein